MTFEAGSAAFAADAEIFHFDRPAPAAMLPANDRVADPEAGWARRNPDRAMLFLFVSPRDCGVVDELMAA
ncbi:MAG TPA: hypothetical protein VGW34_07310 [Allosphingosinicella sp.]|nr:hypothetical protein [Allosphingosinicella sp.]